MQRAKKKRSLAEKINVMRASVMGANDGILSVAGIVIGVAGASSSNGAIFLAGIAGMLAGTISMAMGEYVSVNTQRSGIQSGVQLKKNPPRWMIIISKNLISFNKSTCKQEFQPI